MEIKDMFGIASDIATILAIIIGGWFALFVFLRFAPILSLRILPTWLNNDKKKIILRIEIENKSKVRVHKQVINLQILEYSLRSCRTLSEWIPFEENAIIPTERPISWHEPMEIFKSTKGIDPGEILVIERLHYIETGTFLHVGLQVKAKLSLFGKIATRIRGWNQRWTITQIIIK